MSHVPTLQKLSHNMYEFRLVVDYVTAAHFHWYTIEVDNGMGIRRRAIQLVEGEFRCSNTPLQLAGADSGGGGRTRREPPNIPVHVNGVFFQNPSTLPISRPPFPNSWIRPWLGPIGATQKR